MIMGVMSCSKTYTRNQLILIQGSWISEGLIFLSLAYAVTGLWEIPSTPAYPPSSPGISIISNSQTTIAMTILCINWARRHPQHCCVPIPKPSCGLEVVSKSTPPSALGLSQRSGSKSLKSHDLSHLPQGLALFELSLHVFSSTGTEGDMMPGPALTIKHWTPLGTLQPRISVSLAVSLTITKGVRRRASSMTALR